MVYESDAAKSDIYLENAFQYDGSSQHSKYKFDSLHFHWGPGDQNGSEHVYTGQTTTLEVHFVHYSSDYDSVGAAVAAWDALSEEDSQDMHTLGVVGFLFEEVHSTETYNEKADAILLELANNSAMQDVWTYADGAASLNLVIYDLVDPDDSIWSYYRDWHLIQNTV